MSSGELPAPARYFPAASGRYDVTPSLRPLGTDFGHGRLDALAFQLDRRFPEYRARKLGVRVDTPAKYVGQADLDGATAEAVARWMVDRLEVEHPEWFRGERRDGAAALHCRLTGETLRFDAQMRLVETESSGVAPAVPAYADAFDALCSQLQEDVAVVRTEGARDWIAAYHVSMPSQWRPESKRGLPFSEVHAAVPGMEPVNRVAAALVAHMVRRGPFVRFVWGIDTHRSLSRHPDPPPGVSAEEWRGPRLDPRAASPFVLRVERQVTWGLPEVGAAVFLIRLYQIEAEALTMEERGRLRAALLTMSRESRAYKDVARHWDDLLAWLASERSPRNCRDNAGRADL